jgi:uncharacterized protein YjiS (DUF1127 family)
MSLGHLLMVGSADILRRSAPERALGHVVTLWARLFAERRALSQLDERLLRDIGLNEGDAAREAARPFWDIPVGRR